MCMRDHDNLLEQNLIQMVNYIEDTINATTYCVGVFCTLKEIEKLKNIS
jgi:hypothetical protein